VHPHYDSIKHEIDSSLNTIFNEQKLFTRRFITENSSSLASLIALYQVFGQQKVMNEKDDFDIFEMLSRNLGAKYPQNDHVKGLSERVNTLKQYELERNKHEAELDSGNVAPDISLKTIAGTPVKLSSFKGQYVLVYFWAGWSSQSQLKIPFYRYLYLKYGTKGFNILGISLDKDRQTWENSVRQNKMRWPQGSDLLEWDSPLVKEYNITSIPAVFLIDRNGRILIKRPDDNQLANFLYRIYNM
jgi:peroxiredoxin